MKSTIAMLLLTVAAATAAENGTLLNPKRFTAKEVRQEGDVTHFHGNAVVRWGTAALFSEDIEHHAGHSDMKVVGDSRLEVLNVKPNPGFRNAPMSPKLFSADDVRKEGDLAIFHGQVRITVTGAFRIDASDAVLNTVTGSIAVKGDATVIMQKRSACTTDIWTGQFTPSPCESYDDLGPLTVSR